MDEPLSSASHPCGRQVVKCSRNSDLPRLEYIVAIPRPIIYKFAGNVWRIARPAGNNRCAEGTKRGRAMVGMKTHRAIGQIQGLLDRGVRPPDGWSAPGMLSPRVRSRHGVRDARLATRPRRAACVPADPRRSRRRPTTRSRRPFSCWLAGPRRCTRKDQSDRGFEASLEGSRSRHEPPRSAGVFTQRQSAVSTLFEPERRPGLTDRYVRKSIGSPNTCERPSCFVTSRD